MFWACRQDRRARNACRSFVKRRLGKRKVGRLRRRCEKRPKNGVISILKRMGSGLKRLRIMSDNGLR
jgi:hypothetical protein